MKITIYTTATCQFSKQEKEYLTGHQLSYDEKSLETNKDFLTEMLAISNNFAGTPVTRVEKDNGQMMILKGFTKDEFDQALGFAQPVQQAASPSVQSSLPPVVLVPQEVTTVQPPAIPSAPTPEPITPPVAPLPPMQPPEPAVPDQMPSVQPEPTLLPVEELPDVPIVPNLPPTPPVAPVNSPVETPITAPAQPEPIKTDELDAILNDLQAKVGQVTPPAETPGMLPASTPPQPPVN